ncbi:hypothetical protein Tco_0026348 [Tanacetum coccineum]
MSTQQDIYATGSENRPPILNKDNYVLWSSRLLRYAKIKPNVKLIYNSIMHGPYVRRMIPEPGDLDLEVPVAETFHEQTDKELTEKRRNLDLHEVDYTQLYDFLKYNQAKVVQNAVQNLGIQNVGNQNGLNFVLGIANQNLNPNKNGYHEKIKEVNANCILMANLQQGSTSGTQTDKPPVYDSDRSAEVHHSENCYNNDIFNMFTQEEQYTELLKPIPEPHQVQQNDSNVIFVVSNVEQSEGTVEQHPATVEETHALYDSLYNNLATKVKTVNSVNHNLKETNAELSTELTRYKNHEKCLKSIKKSMTNLKGVIKSLFIKSNLSKEKSTVSSLQEEKKKLKSDFKIREDELLDKQIQLKNKIKELDNISVKMDEIFPIVDQVDARLQNFGIQFLKEATKFVRDFKSLVKEADESLAKHKALEFEIECLLRAV